MTSRRSSGSIRAESAVEPTRSENITVTCRRSAVSWVSGPVAATGVGEGASGGATRAAIASSSFLRCPNDADADVLEIVVCQPAQQLAVDVVGAENLGILGETDRAEPTVDIQIRSPRFLSPGVLEKVELLAPTVIPRDFAATWDSSCGRQPLDSSIATPSPDTRPI